MLQNVVTWHCRVGQPSYQPRLLGEQNCFSLPLRAGGEGWERVKAQGPSLLRSGPLLTWGLPAASSEVKGEAERHWITTCPGIPLCYVSHQLEVIIRAFLAKIVSNQRPGTLFMFKHWILFLLLLFELIVWKESDWDSQVTKLRPRTAKFATIVVPKTRRGFIKKCIIKFGNFNLYCVIARKQCFIDNILQTPQVWTSNLY